MRTAAIWVGAPPIGLMIVVSKATSKDIRMKIRGLHAPEPIGFKNEYIQEHQADAGH